MTALVVVSAGATTTLQDGGRRGLARYGVPRSGPVDVLSHRLAARLAGVDPDQVDRAVALEVGPHPTTVGAEGGRLALAVAGAQLVVRHRGNDVAAPCVVPLDAGERCTVTARTWGYAVPAARLEVPTALGSRSRHPRSGLGPTVESGTVLQVQATWDTRCGRWPHPAVPAARDGRFGLLPAPQTELFSQEALRRLTEEEYRTTTSFDRMGHRLAGPTLTATAGHDIVSDGIVAGALQVPGDGHPFLLTADHQTTGGYPKVAVLASADLARFVRLAPGSAVPFAWTDVAAARARLRAAIAAVEDVVGMAPSPLGSVLGAANLIAGVTDGAPPDHGRH